MAGERDGFCYLKDHMGMFERSGWAARAGDTAMANIAQKGFAWEAGWQEVKEGAAGGMERMFALGEADNIGTW